MGIVRKSGVTQLSTRSSADANLPRIRPGGAHAIDGPAAKIPRPSAPEADSEPRRPSITEPVITVTQIPGTGTASLRSMVMSLDHYRLKPAAILPAANAQGLRNFAGRIFVDVAHGDIVQVRQNAITGEYRATLPSERVASGPVLVLDRQTMIWKTEQPTVLSDIGNTVHTRHENQPSPAHGHFYEGLNDNFELRVSLGATIVARGLQHFPPQHAATLRSELRATEQIFFDASTAIGVNYIEAEGVFQGYFGQNHALAQSRFSECMTRGHALSKEYQGPWGLDKFVAVESDPQRQAWMYPLDFHGRFFINLNYMRTVEFAAILGHEMMHTNRINRFKSVGPGAVDFFYLDALMQDALAHPVRNYDIPERGVSEVIMQGGLTVKYLDGFTSDHNSFNTGVSQSLGLPDNVDVQVAVDLFNANPQVRAQMASNNADSIIYAAKSMQQLHRSRTADSQLLNNLLTS